MQNCKNIAIEASNLADAHPTGIPVYSRNLIEYLNRNIEFKNIFNLSLLLSASRWNKRHLCPKFEGVQKNWYVKKIILKRHVDLIHYTGVFRIHSSKACKIVTIHDIAVLRPEHRIPFYTSKETAEKTHENMVKIAKNADAIIFVSHTSRTDFLSRYTFPEEKTAVVYLGSKYSRNDTKKELPDTIFTKYNIKPKKYYLFIGGLSIRKNVLNIVKAYLLQEREYDLVLAGAHGMGAGMIIHEIFRSDKNRRIKLTGFVTDEEIQQLYSNAGALVFPTYYEGFGMPIIDAMNFGIPVLIGNRGAAPEIANNLAAVADPFNLDSISQGMMELLQMDPNQVEEAKQYAQSFTWERCAQNTLKIYKQLIG